MKKLTTTLLFIAAFAATVYAQSCQQTGMNQYMCGVPTQEFNFMKANSVNGGAQMQSNWCWAACIQMVLNYHNLNVNQTQVVQRIYGTTAANQSANENQILNALQGWAPNNYGGVNRINAVGGYTSVQQMITGLSNKAPLIVGLRGHAGCVGHAYVLTAIEYQNTYNMYGQCVQVPIKVVLRDPWPTAPYGGRTVMSWNEFQQRAKMGVKVWVS